MGYLPLLELSYSHRMFLFVISLATLFLGLLVGPFELVLSLCLNRIEIKTTKEETIRDKLLFIH